MGLSNANILINNNMISYGTVDFENGLTVAGSSSITAANNNKLNIDGTGTKVTGTCNISGALTTGSITCSGNAVITGSLSGTGITTLLGSYYNKSYIDTNFYTQTQLNTAFGNYSTKTISDTTYQKILTNSTEGTGSFGSILGVSNPTSLKYIYQAIQI